MMKSLSILLIFLIGYLQYVQNFDDQGGPRLGRILVEIKEGNSRKDRLIQENEALNKEIKDLIGGYVVIEELARSNMGMIKRGEMLLRVYPPENEVPSIENK